ncbi:hypothetical protein DFH94DRAFT_686677 [Russula ochroleuca]|uniref:Myb/SANT-like domain-containing protein n=1 Tax=Russula ochroleuca TaxID=152965 RepID=A0A9P5JVN8_9AGAM|nr:hypothetical protein DFH94DRAFT_686677 [Russula ochroleuca]
MASSGTQTYPGGKYTHLLTQTLNSLKRGKKLKKEKGPPKNAKWTVANDQALIMVLKAQQLLGNQADNSWKRLVWVATVKELTGSERLSGGAPKKEKSCSDRWSTLKSHFLVIQTLRGLSGFGWDEDQKMVTATDDVWTAYIEAHPNAATWRFKPFFLYDDILGLVEGCFATGDHALHLTEICEDSDDQLPLLGPLVPYRDDEPSPDPLDDIDWLLTPPRQPNTPKHESQDMVKPVKRRHSNASIADGDHIPEPKHSHLTGPVAVQHVADALSSVASSLSSNDSCDFETPQR